MMTKIRLHDAPSEQPDRPLNQQVTHRRGIRRLQFQQLEEFTGSTDLESVL